jgi:toxin ParE1/3/4
MAHRVSERAAADLDDIWYYVAQESASIEIANRLIDSLTDRFLLLGRYPYLDVPVTMILALVLGVFSLGEHVIVYCVEGEDVPILRVAHGRRDIEALFEN